MANPNAIPPEHGKFKPGESGNPAGRPKGARNLSTILKEMLEQEIDYSESDEEPKVKTPFSDIIVKKLIRNAAMGDVRSIQEVFDRTEGKPKQEIDQKTELSGNVGFTGIQIIKPNDPDRPEVHP